MSKNSFNAILFLAAMLVLVLPKICDSQSITELESRIKNSLSEFQALNYSINAKPKQQCCNCEFHDTLGHKNLQFTKYLVDTLPLIPESLTTPIPSIYYPESGIQMMVVSSEDNKLRQWNWVSFVKDSIPSNDQVIEYSTIKSIRTTIPPYLGYESTHYNPRSPKYETIYTIRSKNGTTYYLPIQTFKDDSQTSREKISAITIADTGIVFNCKLFQIRGSLADEIWNYGVRNNTTDGYKNNRIIVINNGNMIMVPEYNVRDKMKLRWITYEFDGEHFVYKGISK